MSGLKKLNAIVKLKSYLSGSQVGPETSVPVTISVRENVSSPTVEGMTITDSNTDVTTLTGGEGFVQGASTLRVTPSRVKALYGASISKIAAFCGDMYAESHTTGALELGTLNMSGYTEVRLIVTDSRGFTVSLSETIKVDPHTRPALSAFALTRDDHSPADVSMSFTGSISSVYICPTFNSAGKAVCPSKQIPDETLKELTAGIDLRTVERMTAESGNILRVRFRDGTEQILVWKDRSRSESWTDEMKRKAKTAAEKRRKKNGER